MDAEWMDRAACLQAPPEAFFHDEHQRSKYRLDIDRATIDEWCHGCPVRVECLEYALTYDQRYGIWGGMTAHERDVMVGQRPRALPGGQRRMRKVR